jgi:hypothetical protein
MSHRTGLVEWAHLGTNTPAKRLFSPAEVCTGVCTVRACMRSAEQFRVVELGFVGEHVAVRVRGDGEITLADVLADRRPRHPGQVQEADPAVAQIMRREHRHTGGGAGAAPSRPRAKVFSTW